MKMYFLALSIFIFFLFFAQHTHLIWAAEEVNVSARSAIAVELKSDQIIFRKSIDAKRPIASTTKVMTALIALEKLPLTKVLTTTARAASAGEAEIYLEPDETMTVENLLYAMLLKSANDAAMVLAEGVAGSDKKFTRLMNTKAKLLKAKNTHFINPHGLYNKKHYSSAYDLYLITKEALKNPVFAEIVATRNKTLPKGGRSPTRRVTNHNKLVLKYDYIKGVKTGYTSEAGYCLIALAKVNNLEILTVVLGAPTSNDCYQDTLNLINYARLNYAYQNFLKKGEAVAKVYLESASEPLIVEARDDLSILHNNKDDLITETALSSNNYLPIKKGDEVGKFKVLKRDTNEVLGEVSLIARNDVQRAKIFSKPAGFFRHALNLLQRFLNFF